MRGIKAGFNAFLESGDKARALRAGYTGILVAALFVASLVQFALSTGVALVAVASPSSSVAAAVCAMVLSLLVSDAAFSFCAATEREGVRRPKANCPWRRMIASIPVQIACAVVLYFVQVLLAILVSIGTMLGAQVGLLCQLVVSLAVTLVTAGVVFQIVDDADGQVEGLRGMRMTGVLLSRSFAALRASLSDIARPTALFLTWGLIAGVALPTIVLGMVGKDAAQASLSAVSLANAGFGAAAAAYTALTVVHYLVASWFELDVLLGVAMRVRESE